jgi:hypothetical protein
LTSQVKGDAVSKREVALQPLHLEPLHLAMILLPPGLWWEMVICERAHGVE